MSSFFERIKAGELFISDGGMGTQLAERGVELTGCVEKINLDDPTILEDIAKSFIDAGSEIIQTNTFGASPLKLAMHGMDDKTEEIIAGAVKAVKKVANGKIYISGSCGPSGRILKPYGDCDPEDMAKSFERQAQELVKGGVDIICVETMTDLIEAVIAVEAVKKIASEIPVMATMTFDPTPRGYFTIMGVSIEAASKGLINAGADLIGSNCGNGIENMIKIARKFKGFTDHPLIIQTNAGLPQISNEVLCYLESPEFMAEKAVELKNLGVSVIGGCCGTTPEHIRAIKDRLKP